MLWWGGYEGVAYHGFYRKNLVGKFVGRQIGVDQHCGGGTGLWSNIYNFDQRLD
jgi:hypothetical protein